MSTTEPTLAIGDRTYAEALRIAEEWLKSKGFRYTPKDVGTHAQMVLAGLTAAPSK